MKKIIAFLFVSSVLTFAACQSKPKTEEAAVDSAAAALDSAATADTSATATMPTTAPGNGAKK